MLQQLRISYSPILATSFWLTCLKNNSLFNFVNNYGLLWSGVFNGVYPEANNSIEAIKQEIDKINHLNTLYEAIVKRKYRLINELIKSPFHDTIRTVLDRFKFPIDDTSPSKLGNIFLTLGINQYFNSGIGDFSIDGSCINPNLIFTDDSYKIKNYCHSLITAIYLQFAWYISGGKNLKECKYCGLLFIPSRPGQEYCNRKSNKGTKLCKSAYHSKQSTDKKKALISLISTNLVNLNNINKEQKIIVLLEKWNELNIAKKECQLIGKQGYKKMLDAYSNFILQNKEVKTN